MPINALGPIPSNVTVSPNGCQSLRVTWTPLTPTSPLTVIHYRVRYQAQGSSHYAFPSSGSSYTITDLAPATMYTVRVDTQTELGYGAFCCIPMPSHHLGVPIQSLTWHLPQCTQSEWTRRQNLDMGLSVVYPWLQLIMVSNPVMVLLLLHSTPFVQLILLLLLSMDPIDA